MAKFSIFFNDNPIHSATFESGVVHIRRNESNDLYISSLAFVPAHAAVILRGTENIIKQLNADFPLIINGDRQSKHHLKNGDVIIIGKHHIVFNTVETTSLDSLPTANKKPENEQTTLPKANLQIMAGKHIGHIVPLKKA